MEKEHIKNRQATEQLLLEAVNRLVEQDGFEGLGINAVAAQAGVSKMLIYRYFGSLNGLIAAYIRQYDFWINVRPELPGRERLGILSRSCSGSKSPRYGTTIPCGALPLGTLDRQRTGGRVA